jgi:predicted short-subunit dehydrogenase-like oxidoreductase (DUF2520 family)
MFGEPGKSFDLRGFAVAIAGPHALAGELERLARALGARPLRLPEGGRALYHAAANFSGAFVVALIAETVALWKKLGIAEGDALRALLPLLRGSVDNVEKLGAAWSRAATPAPSAGISRRSRKPTRPRWSSTGCSACARFRSRSPRGR